VRGPSGRLGPANGCRPHSEPVARLARLLWQRQALAEAVLNCVEREEIKAKLKRVE